MREVISYRIPHFPAADEEVEGEIVDPARCQDDPGTSNNFVTSESEPNVRVCLGEDGSEIDLYC